MSQALHTASTGINVGQQQINVVANNVANMNTTAYKTANMVFETLYSNNLSYGSAATKDGGGTNPKQIGLGVKVGGITRDFSSGGFVSTGRDLDTMISGTGFYVVKDSDGTQYYTRDGIFSMDSDGNLVTQSGMKVVATETPYSNASSDKTVKIPTTLRAVVQGDPDIGSKKLSELNNASISSGNVVATVTGTDSDGNPKTATVNLTVPDGDPTIDEVVSSFNSAISAAGVSGVTFSASNGTISYSGTISFPDSTDTTSNILGQTGLSRSSTSEVLNETVTISEAVNYNDSNTRSINSTAIDENGIIIATYDDGSILTQYVDNTQTLQWKYTTPDGVTIKGSDVTASGASITNSNFAIELATMVNQEGLVSINNNLWKWGPDVGEIYYGMAGEMSFGALDVGGYEESNVDIATELTNMITANRLVQMNSRVFSTASSMMETLSYLGQ